MIKVFKEKAPQIKAVEMGFIATQVQEVADLIGAESYQVDLASKQVTYAVEGHDSTYTLKQGQIIAVVGAEIQIFEPEDFYAKYETV